MLKGFMMYLAKLIFPNMLQVKEDEKIRTQSRTQIILHLIVAMLLTSYFFLEYRNTAQTYHRFWIRGFAYSCANNPRLYQGKSVDISALHYRRANLLQFCCGNIDEFLHVGDFLPFFSTHANQPSKI